MTTGLIIGHANSWLNMIRAVAYTAPAGTFIKLHTGDPGAAATANASAVTTRVSATFSAASAGSISLSNSPAFSMTATEVITHLSVWDNISAGSPLCTGALTASKSVVNTDTLTFTSLVLSLAPIAA